MRTFLLILFSSSAISCYCQEARGYAKFTYHKNAKQVHEVMVKDDSSILSNISLSRRGVIVKYSVSHVRLDEKVEFVFKKNGNLKSIVSYFPEKVREQYSIRNGKAIKWESYKDDTLVGSYKRRQDEFKQRIADTAESFLNPTKNHLVGAEFLSPSTR